MVTFLNSVRAWSAATVLSIAAVLETNISQGSVATPLIFGWICNDRFNANFLPSVTVKKCRKSINTWRRCGQEFGVLFLRATAYMLSAYMLSQFRPSVRLSVCPSVRHTGGSVKNG